jgi:hypothetical protein
MPYTAATVIGECPSYMSKYLLLKDLYSSELTTLGSEYLWSAWKQNFIDRLYRVLFVLAQRRGSPRAVRTIPLFAATVTRINVLDGNLRLRCAPVAWTVAWKVVKMGRERGNIEHTGNIEPLLGRDQEANSGTTAVA